VGYAPRFNIRHNRYRLITRVDFGKQKLYLKAFSNPLCPDCHTLAPGSYHRIGKREFERLNKLSIPDLVVRLQGEWRCKCA
jgi:hypothetical protein